MQLDSLLFNLVVFALAQIVALGFLRTGLPWRGIRLMMTTWVLADIALIARFGLQRDGLVFSVPISAMQVYTVLQVALFTMGRLRRRMRGQRRRREDMMRRAFIHYLRDELAIAERIYRRLVRADPWDLQSKVGWASVSARLGRTRRARRILRSARGLAAQAGWLDLIAAEQARMPTPAA